MNIQNENTGKNLADNFEQVMFKVAGNCSMCKGRIEAAAKSLEGVNNAEWDEETKIVHINFINKKITPDDIHKAIAAVGHDTEKEKAPDEVYNKLPDCCKYRNK